jgi:hypothetical protein
MVFLGAPAAVLESRQAMRLRATALLLLAALGVAAEEPTPVYQEEKKQRFVFTGDGLAREEWTRDIYVTGDNPANQDRWRFQLRPQVEGNLGKFTFGVGADLNYSQYANYDPDNPPLLLRDNFNARNARLDLAFGRFEGSWVMAEGGRFVMPVALTEMLWDKDLRPQGAALTFSLHDRGALKSLSATALYAKSSHVFPEEVAVLVASGQGVFEAGPEATIQVLASYVQFTNTNSLSPFLRRQNPRVAPTGPVAGPFRIVDGVVRYQRPGRVPVLLVADYAWNTAADDLNRGLWLSAVLGTPKTRVRLEYVYSQMDWDATLGAYDTDDFFWATGWLGDRVDAGVRLADKLSFHAVGQWQRFKDSPVIDERDHWVERYRLELRYNR